MESVVLGLYLQPVDSNSLDFRIEVDRPGQATGDSTLPYPPEQLRIVLRALESLGYQAENFGPSEVNWLLEHQFLVDVPGGYDFPDELQKRIGQQLFETLFPEGDVRRQFDKAWTLAEHDKTELHIQLKFDHDIPSRSCIADYPWELLHFEQRFLAQDRVTFSRYLRYSGLPTVSPSIKLLNVLILSARPFDPDGKLDDLPDLEPQIIREAIGTGAGYARELPHVTYGKLLNYLNSNQGSDAPTIIHFDGHGAYGWRCNKESCLCLHTAANTPRVCKKCNSSLPEEPQGYLAFENDEGEVAWIGADEFATMILQSTHLSKDDTRSRIHAVVLTSCRSGYVRRSGSLFNGVAQRLIQCEVPAVVAMAFIVAETSARKFVRGFYQSVAREELLRVAVAKGRTEMGYSGDQWYRPVLYERHTESDSRAYLPAVEHRPGFTTLQMILAGDTNEFTPSYQDILSEAVSETLGISEQIEVSKAAAKNCVFILQLPQSAALRLVDSNENSLLRRIEQAVIAKAVQEEVKPEHCLILRVKSGEWATESYQPSFKNRDQERQIVLDPGSPRYIEICASAGQGKTYLLNELQNEFPRLKDPWRVVRIDFGGSNPPLTGADVLGEIGKQLKEKDLKTTVQLARLNFKKALHLVLLLDSTEYIDPTLPEWLISDLLPALDSRQVLDNLCIIAAGRRKVDGWQSRFKSLPLSSFPPHIIKDLLKAQKAKREDVKTQLESTWYENLAKEIFDLTKGYPL